jgi:hypothetical protein
MMWPDGDAPETSEVRFRPPNLYRLLASAYPALDEATSGCLAPFGGSGAALDEGSSGEGGKL